MFISPIGRQGSIPRHGKRLLAGSAIASLALLLLSLLFATSAHAQVLYGSLTGTVTDASGAVVASAEITALETSTGVQATTTSDSAGIYHFATLAPGTYKVTISAK